MKPIKKSFLLVTFTICLLLSFCCIINIAKADQMQVLSHWDYGGSYDVAASGDYLYVAAGEQVRIYDISTKDKLENIKMEPIRLYGYRNYGTYKEKTPPVNILHTGGLIEGLDIEGNYLYIANRKGLVIADISDPGNAFIISSLDIGECKDVQAQGNYAYLTSPNPYGDDITIVDISDKKNPVKVAGINVDEIGGHWNGIRRLYVEGNYLYTGDSNNFLYIIDISDPANPTVVGKWYPEGVSGTPSSFAKNDNYVFVVRYHYGFYVIDVSDPTNPVKVAEVIGMNNPNANDIKILGDYLFISTRYEGFRIYNISDPTNPSLVTTFSGWSAYAEGIFVHQLPYGTYVFETGWSSGWVIINATDFQNPELLSHMPVPLGDSVEVKGNYMFIGSHNDGAWVVDVSDPSNPQEVVWIQVDGRNKGLTIDGDYLYGTGCWGDIWIVNISNPEDPIIEVMDYGPNADLNPIVVDDYLYAQTYDANNQYVTIYDVSDKKNPQLIYQEDLGLGYRQQPLDRYGDSYLIWGSEEGLFIVDISNRTDPKVVGNYSVGVADAKVLGDIVYAVGGGYLYSIDISDVTNPKFLDKIECDGNALVIYGSVAYVLPRVIGGTLKAVDISDPTNLSVIDTLDGIGGDDYMAGIEEENGLLFTNSGFIISPIGGGELPLQISLIKVSSITENSAIISWQTNKPADSLVKYGTSPGSYTEQKYDPNPTKYHSIYLDNLSPNTTYYFVVESKTANETATSTEKSFKTKAPDVIPPVITIVSPENNSLIEGGTPLITIVIETDEPAICQYSFSDFNYGEGTNFTQTGGTEHTFNLSVEDGKSYTIYYRCQDLSPQRNANTESKIHSFSIATSWWDYFDDEIKVERKENIEISNGSAKIKFPENKVYPTKDAVITPEWMANRSSGKGDFGVGYFDRYRSLLEFEIPNGTGEIKSVRLYLYVSKTESSDENNTILLHKLTKTFDEDDCDYEYRDKSENLTWDNYGGDFDPIVIDSLDVSGDLKGKWLVFTLKGAGAENPIDVKWGDTIGLILRPKITWGVYRVDWFKSREASEEYRPYLEIIAGSTSGYFVSAPITPTSLKSWDKFYANFSAPTGTNITFSILDASTNLPLCTNLTGNGDDISQCLKGTTSIKLKAELETSAPPTTPILNEWRVTWIPSGVSFGTLKGKVIDKDDNSPIEGAIIKAGYYQTLADSSGSYTLSLPAGSYTVKVSKPGYLSQSKTISILENQTFAINFSISGINLYLNIKTTKDTYGIGEVVNLTDPPEEERKEVPCLYNFFRLIFEGFLTWLGGRW